MNNYVLVHGAWGGAWEFNALAKLLSANGSKVTALDLPGHGSNERPIADVNMQAWVQTVVDHIELSGEKTVLVGHSLAGAVISQVAELIPEKIERLVFVAAMLLKNGDSPLSVMQADPEGELLPNTIFSEDQSYATITEQTVRDVLLNDVKDEKVLLDAMPHFAMKQATQPFMAQAQLTEANFGSVTKTYVRASIDKAISPAAQDKMLSNWAVDKLVTLPSGHFPLTSMVDKLAEAII